MMSVRKKELSFEDWKSYVFLMISWMCETEDVSISDVFEFYLLKDNIKVEKPEGYDQAKQYVKTKLQIIIKGQKVNRMNVAKVLCGYYELIEEKQTAYILNCVEIKDLLLQNFKMFIAGTPTNQDAINVITLNGNDLNGFVKANHISRFGSRGLMDSSMISCENLVIDYVIDYFSSNKEKSSHLKEAREMYGNEINRYKTLSNIKELDLVQEKKYIFGTEEKYHKFLNDCFVKR